jgi:hypothetical protein
MEGLDDDLGKCSEFCQDRQIFPLSIFDGFSRARISRFSFFAFTSSPVCRKML